MITLASAPIHWVSKHPTEIVLSTTEAEYITLSTCARELILLHAILTELLNYGPIDKHNIILQNNTMLQTPTLKSTHNPKLYLYPLPLKTILVASSWPLNPTKN